MLCTAALPVKDSNESGGASKVDRQNLQNDSGLVENQQGNIVQHPFAFSNFAASCKFLHFCRHWTSSDGSQPVFEDDSSDLYRLNDKFRLIPLLLQHRRYQSEATAVNYHFDTISTPPRLHFTYAKNKLITSGDIQRAEELETILKQNVLEADFNTFFRKIAEFMARHMSPKIARILRENFVPLQKIRYYIENLLRSKTDPISQFDNERDRPGDTWIRASLWKGKGITPTEAFVFKISEIFGLTIHNQLRVTAEALVIICECSSHLCNSTVFRTILVGIKNRELQQDALKLWESLRTLGGYFDASKMMWTALGSEPYMTTLDLLKILPADELTRCELIEIAGKVGLQDYGMEVPTGEKFEDFFEFVEHCMREAGGNTTARDDWLNVFPALRDWSPIIHLKESLPAEIKLAFHLLKEGRRGTISIATSETPSLLTEYWVDSFNEVVPFHLMKIRIQRAGKSVGCINWKMTGVKSVDRGMAKKVSEQVASIIGSFTLVNALHRQQAKFQVA